MDFNYIAENILTWVYAFVGGGGFGAIVAFLLTRSMRKAAKKLKELTDLTTDDIHDYVKDLIPNSLIVDLSALTSAELARIKAEIASLIHQELDYLKQLNVATVETLAALHSTPTDRAQALMGLIKKPFVKEVPIKIDKNPKLFKQKIEQKGGGNYLEVD